MQIFSRAFNVDLTTVTGVSTTLSIGYQIYVLILLTKSTFPEILELFYVTTKLHLNFLHPFVAMTVSLRLKILQLRREMLREMARNLF